MNWENPISIRLSLLAVIAAAAPGLLLTPCDDLVGQERQDSTPDSSQRVLVQGTVVDNRTGNPVPSAVVSLGAGPSGNRGRGTRVSDDEGRFSFREVPEGTYRILVSAPSYRTMRDTLQVPAGEDLELILPLSEDPIPLEPIIVTAEQRAISPRRDWEQRARSRSVFLITREDFEHLGHRNMSDLLNAVPGSIVVPTPPYGYTLLLRGQCRPAIFLDGVELLGATSIDQLMSPHDVEAIEVYHGFELPVEFGVNPCGGILIWTRMGRPDPPGTDTSEIFGRFAIAAGLTLLGFFLYH